MIYTKSSLSAKCDVIHNSLNKAEALIIGAGAGLSAAAGLAYGNADTFNTLFPGYYERYGLKTINEAIFFQFPTREEYYAFWIRLISTIRYNHPAGKPYLDLYRILNRKEYVIITTNTDGQFLKVGFPPKKICSPQGDYAYFQCSRPCNTELYHNEQMVKEILFRITNTDFAIPAADIPHCPQCGSPLVPNIRYDDTFVDKPWMGQYQKINDLLHANIGKNLLLLELGVGYNTPQVIRYPFEMLALERKNTELIRINLNDDTISLVKKSQQAIFIKADLGTILNKVAEES
jgi:NAD-dependent SIR2 family protein deacetylase